MIDIRAASSKLITQLLSTNSPELGARLKQRLNAAFIANGLGSFDEKSFGFAKFTDYLLRAHGDLVSVEREEGVGDILVSLRVAPTPQAHPRPSPKLTENENAKVIRSEVWQAFTNPDPERKRFFDRRTGRVVHFLVGKHSAEQREVEASADNFLEIPPIGGDLQVEWMREFLTIASLASSEKDALEGLISNPYSSAVNLAFSRALGAHSLAWRKYRTERVTAHIEQWASDVGVLLAKLHVDPSEPSISAHQVSPSLDLNASLSAALSAQSPSDLLSPREQVSKLLELLSDDDILRLVIPTLLSTILIKSRM